MNELKQNMPIESPCNSVCRISTVTGVCEGCFRTIDEIVAWGQLHNESKKAILDQVAIRKKSHAT